MYKPNVTYHFNFFITFCKRLLLPVVLISIYSCKKTFSSGQFVDDKLVVLAEITAGDSMEIPIGKTIKVGNGGLIRFEKVKEAQVSGPELTPLVMSPRGASAPASEGVLRAKARLGAEAGGEIREARRRRAHA